MSTENHEYEIDGEVISSKNGAEIFNDYQHNIASGDYSHAEGSETIASGPYSHAEGSNTVASGNSSHSEGYGNTASGHDSHAEGTAGIASGLCSHTEGANCKAIGDYSHAEGASSQSTGLNSHAENCSFAIGEYSHSEGSGSKAIGRSSHAQGTGTHSYGENSNSEGYQTTAFGDSSHIEGCSSHICDNVIEITDSTTDEEIQTVWLSNKFSFARGSASHAEGIDCLALGKYSHAEGRESKALGEYSHSEGVATVANTFGAHAEGTATTASGQESHAEGNVTIASGTASHAEGHNTVASATCSHAEGFGTKASGHYSHSEGFGTKASGHYSHSEGIHTIASSDYQHVQGKFNVEDTDRKYAFIIGNGSDIDNRSNAIEIDWKGNIFCYGDETSLNAQIDANTKKLSGIEDNANNYVHPTTSGNKHIPSGGSSGQILRWSADGTAVWGDDKDTKYSNATQSASGLMTAEDKTKLDGIAIGANKTVVDTALSSTSTNPVQNKVVKAAIDGKAASSHTHSQYYDSTISRTANTVLAAPNGSDGTASFRKLVLADIPTGQWNAIPLIRPDGVMEIGKYIDFHTSSSSTADYDVRITAESTGLTISGTTKGNFSGSLSGNASSATKLATARTINGVAFDGSKNITVPLRSCYAYDDSSTFADTPWHKVASISLTGTNVDRIAIFHVDKGWTDGGFSGILRARIRVGSTAGKIEHYSLTWEFVNDGFITMTGTLMSQDFCLSIYNDTTTGKAKANLWVKITSRYDGWQFTLLSQGDRVGPNNGYWTLINSSSGVENILDGKTLSGQTPAICSTISNPIKYMYLSDVGAEIETTRANLQDMVGIRDSGWRTLVDKVKYRKIGNIVEVRGTYTAPNSGGGMTIGTLPSGYRPSNSSVYNTNSVDSTASNIYYTSVSTAGVVIISGMSGSTFTKDSTYNVNIMFMVG